MVHETVIPASIPIFIIDVGGSMFPLATVFRHVRSAIEIFIVS